MTIDEAKQAHIHKATVIYKDNEHFIDHIIYRFDWKELKWKISLYLIPCNYKNSTVVARMCDCEIKREAENEH